MLLCLTTRRGRPQISKLFGLKYHSLLEGGGYDGKLLIFLKTCITDFEMGRDCDSYLFSLFQRYLHTRGTTVYNLTTGRLVNICMSLSCLVFGPITTGYAQNELFPFFCFVNYFKNTIRKEVWKGKCSLYYLVWTTLYFIKRDRSLWHSLLAKDDPKCKNVKASKTKRQQNDSFFVFCLKLLPGNKRRLLLDV